MHTERLAVDWIVRFVRCHGMRSRNGLVPSGPQIKAFLIDLGVARSTCPMHWLGNTLMPPRHGVGRLVPALTLPVGPPVGLTRRHHSDPSVINKASEAAVRCAGLTKHVSAHTVRHASGTHPRQRGTDLRTIQHLLGHNDVATAMIGPTYCSKAAGAFPVP
jgi:integrase